MNDGAHHSPLDALLGAAPRRARRHLVSIAILAVTTIAVAFLLVRFVTGTQNPYYFALVERGDIAPLISERGIVRGGRETTIKARFEGMITSVPGPASGVVRFGQTLAVIDTRPLRQALEIDRAEVQAAEASLEAVRVTLQATQARLARFESVWRRSGQQVPSLDEMEAARADAGRAKQEEAGALARLQAARMRVSNGLQQLRHAVIRSPIDGYVVSRYVEPGQQALEGLPLFTLAKGFDRLTIAIPLTDAQASQLRPGAMAAVRIDDMPDEAQSAKLVRLVANGGRRSAVFELEKPAAKVAPGMRATVEAALPKRHGVLLVPDAALDFSLEGSTGRERDWIYLLSDDGEPRRVYVSAGASDGKRTEIFAEGVEPGARVITGWRNAPANGGGPR